MSISKQDLDAKQQAYKQAVNTWVDAIRAEEALASVDHSEAKLDQWEEAAQREDSLRKQAKDAKKDYEGALREEFFNF